MLIPASPVQSTPGRVLGIGSRREPLPYSCSFQTSMCFEMGPAQRREEGSDLLGIWWLSLTEENVKLPCA
jgi:hypothetical protein